MAVTWIAGAPVIECNAANDFVSVPITLRGVRFVHTTNGSVRLAAGANGTAANTIYFQRATGAPASTDWFYPPIYLPNGFRVVSMTGTSLLLYI